MGRRSVTIAAFVCATGLFWLHPVWADVSPRAADQKTGDTARVESLWNRETLFGDMGGLRPTLGRAGITLGLQETSEYLRDMSGGARRGGGYLGLTQLTLALDTEKAFGWLGGTFFTSALQIHGRSTSFTAYNVGGMQTISNIEAEPDTRLWELWYEQAFSGGKADLRLGQQAIDQEFMVSEYGGTFDNAMFGWAALPSNDLPSGGPAYPLSSLGARLRLKPSDSVTLLAGVFDGYPAGRGDGDPQKMNSRGLEFRLHGGALWIAELQYNAAPALFGAQSGGLPGVYKIGGWYHTGGFDDQRYDSTGLSLADPASSGVARAHDGDYSFYAMADQMVWRASPGSARSVGVFARAMWAPSERNLVDFSANAGFVLRAPFQRRPNDELGVGIGYARISSGARGLDRDAIYLGTSEAPVRDGETFVELTYKYQVAPWWQLQADAQYVIHPGGGTATSEDPVHRTPNAFILGLRTSIAF